MLLHSGACPASLDPVLLVWTLSSLQEKPLDTLMPFMARLVCGLRSNSPSPYPDHCVSKLSSKPLMLTPKLTLLDTGFSVSSGTPELLAGECTSCQVSEDKSAYWTPALYFQHASTGNFELVQQVGGMLA